MGLIPNHAIVLSVMTIFIFGNTLCRASSMLKPEIKPIKIEQNDLKKVKLECNMNCKASEANRACESDGHQAISTPPKKDPNTHQAVSKKLKYSIIPSASTLNIIPSDLFLKFKSTLGDKTVSIPTLAMDKIENRSLQAINSVEISTVSGYRLINNSKGSQYSVDESTSKSRKNCESSIKHILNEFQTLDSTITFTTVVTVTINTTYSVFENKTKNPTFEVERGKNTSMKTSENTSKINFDIGGSGKKTSNFEYSSKNNIGSKTHEIENTEYPNVTQVLSAKSSKNNYTTSIGLQNTHPSAWISNNPSEKSDKTYHIQKNKSASNSKSLIYKSLDNEKILEKFTDFPKTLSKILSSEIEKTISITTASITTIQHLSALKTIDSIILSKSSSTYTNYSSLQNHSKPVIVKSAPVSKNGSKQSTYEISSIKSSLSSSSINPTSSLILARSNFSFDQPNTATLSSFSTISKSENVQRHSTIPEKMLSTAAPSSTSNLHSSLIYSSMNSLSNTQSSTSTTLHNTNYSKPRFKPTKQQFLEAIRGYRLTSRGGVPPDPSDLVYEKYLEIIAPKMDLNEQAMILSHCIWESTGLRDTRELACKDEGCSYGKFYGRGYIHLTWKNNYKNSSNFIFGDDRLIYNPDFALDPENAWKIALWFWETQVRPRNQKALDNFDLGVSTKIINGKFECSPSGKAANDRLKIYENTLLVWGAKPSKTPNLAGC